MVQRVRQRLTTAQWNVTAVGKILKKARRRLGIHAAPHLGWYTCTLLLSPFFSFSFSLSPACRTCEAKLAKETSARKELFDPADTSCGRWGASSILHEVSGGSGANGSRAGRLQGKQYRDDAERKKTHVALGRLPLYNGAVYCSRLPHFASFGGEEARNDSKLDIPMAGRFSDMIFP